MKCGIVGLPNVGKSTLFNLMTASRKARAENFPFCTIDPNIASVQYIDSRLQKLKEHYKSVKIIYALLEFVDIAGLVPNAHAGEGLGNKFLGHISETDCILHVVRTFDGDVTHVIGNIDPVRDIEVTRTEFILSDMEKVDRMLKKAKNDEELLIAKKQLENNQKTTHPQLLSSKPMVILCNGQATQDLIDYCIKHKLKLLSLDIGLLEELSFECRMNHITDETIEKQISEIVKLCLEELNMITYFTAGPKEARAWMIPANTPAYDGAGKIHSDFVKKLVACEVIEYNEFPSKPKNMKRDYIIKDADVIEFLLSR